MNVSLMVWTISSKGGYCCTFVCSVLDIGVVLQYIFLLLLMLQWFKIITKKNYRIFLKFWAWKILPSKISHIIASPQISKTSQLSQILIFTESARFSLVVAMSVRPIAWNRCLRPNGLSLQLLVEDCVANIDKPLQIYGFFQFWWFLAFGIFSGFSGLCEPANCA